MNYKLENNLRRNLPMFNFEEGKIDFESVEEVKEFLLGTDDLNVLGALCFTNPDGTVQQEVPISVLIEQEGVDKVAEMLFNLTKDAQPELMAISRDEAFELFEKVKRGEELTEEEKRKLNIIAAATENGHDRVNRRRDSLFNGITMTLVQSSDIPLFNTVGGNLAMASTYLECALVTSDEKLRRAFSNQATSDDVVNLATSKIHIDEDMSVEMTLLGLLHKIGELATYTKEIREKPMNFEAITEVLELDAEWIFAPDEKIASSMDCVQEILELLSNGSNEDDEDDSEEISEQNENGSNNDKPENIVNIRDRLKRK
jgi:hypothetical protein